MDSSIFRAFVIMTVSAFVSAVTSHYYQSKLREALPRYTLLQQKMATFHLMCVPLHIQNIYNIIRACYSFYARSIRENKEEKLVQISIKIMCFPYPFCCYKAEENLWKYDLRYPCADLAIQLFKSGPIQTLKQEEDDHTLSPIFRKVNHIFILTFPVYCFFLGFLTSTSVNVGNIF